MFVRITIVIFVATALAWTIQVRASDSAGPQTVYVVQGGDTLWSVATKHYRGDPRAGVWKLQRANAVSGGSLTPGQRLVVPR